VLGARPAALCSKVRGRARGGRLAASASEVLLAAAVSKAKRRLDELAGVRDWRLHDLRRTATTGMAKLGVEPHVADRILNHKQGVIRGVAAVYNRHAYLDERRAALNLWAGYVLRLVQPTDAEVVTLRA
jgi:integrase